MNVFCVVEFTEENSLEVVPRAWIDDDLRYCYYKSDPSVAKLRKDVNSRPSADWPRYEIKIKYQHESYQVAAKACDKLQFTSNVDSSDSSGSEVDVSRRSRKRKPREIYSPTDRPTKSNKTRQPKRSGNHNGLNSRKTLFPTEAKSIKKNRILPPLSPLFSSPPATFDQEDREVSNGPCDEAEPDVDSFVSGINQAEVVQPMPPVATINTDFNHPQIVTVGQILPPENIYLDIDRSNSISVAGTSICGSESGSNSCKSLLFTPSSTGLSSPSPSLACETLTEIRRFQEVVLRELGSIKEEVKIIKTWVKRGEGAWTSPINVPFNSEGDLNSAEAQLSSEAIRNSFQGWCELIGGSDYKHHVRRALSRLFAHEFSLLVNMSGVSPKGRKIAFGTTSVCKILISGISKSNNVKEDLVEKSIGKWFRGCTDRNGGRLERKR